MASGMEEAPDGGDGAVDAGGVDVQVRGETQAVQARGQHALRASGAPAARPSAPAPRPPGRRRGCWSAAPRPAGPRSRPGPRPGGARARGPLRGDRCGARSAWDAAAASMPAWRMPPPAILRMRWARAINSREPHSADPTGAPRPLLKQTETLSKHCAMRRASARASVPRCAACATAALKSRAPSRWRARPLRCASCVACST